MIEKKQLLELVLAKTYDEAGIIKLACEDALNLAEEFGIDPKRITAICNKENIKIGKCQLGCFK